MASSFPSSLDNFTNPTPTDAMNSATVDHATQHSNLNDAVENVETKVGVDSSSVTTSHDFKVRGQLISTQTSTARVNAIVTNQVKLETDTGRFMLGNGSSYGRHFFGPSQTAYSQSSEMLYGYAPGTLVSSGTVQNMTFSSGVDDRVGWGTGSSFTTLTVPQTMEGLWSITLLCRTARSKALSIRQFGELMHTPASGARYYRKIFGLEVTADQRFVIPLVWNDTLVVRTYVSGDTDYYDAFLWMHRIGY